MQLILRCNLLKHNISIFDNIEAFTMKSLSFPSCYLIFWRKAKSLQRLNDLEYFHFQLQILCKIFLCGPLWPWNPTCLLITWYDLCVTKLQSVLCNLALSAEKYKPDVKNIWLSKEKMYVVYIIPGKECNKLQNQSKKNSCSRACKLNQSGKCIHTGWCANGLGNTVQIEHFTCGWLDMYVQTSGRKIKHFIRKIHVRLISLGE